MARPPVRSFVRPLAVVALLGGAALVGAPRAHAQQDSTTPAPAPARDAHQRDVTTYRDASTTRDTNQRDISTYRDTRTGADTAPTTLMAPARPAPATNAPPANPSGVNTYGIDSAAAPTARDTTAASDTGAATRGRGVRAGADSLTRDLTAEQCDTLGRRVAGGGELPTGASAVAMQTYVVPDGPPPADLRGTSVRLRFRVGPDGFADPASLTVVGSSDAAFRQRALAAVRGMQFRPAEYRGCVLPGAIEVPVHFDSAAVSAAKAAAPAAKPKPKSKAGTPKKSTTKSTKSPSR
jgi:TonB family protein